MSYLSLLEKFNKTDSRLPRGEFFNFQLFSLYGMVIGNFFHLSVCRFVFALVLQWRFEDNRLSNVITCSALCHLAVPPWPRGVLVFVTYFGRTKVSQNAGLRHLGSATRKKGKRTAEVRDKKRIPRNIPRHMLDGTSRLPEHTRETSITPRPSYPIRLQSRRNSNLRTDCPGCVFRTYEKWVWPGAASTFFSSSSNPAFRSKLF